MRKICDYCNNEFSESHPRTRFCSHSCSAKYQHSHNRHPRGMLGKTGHHKGMGLEEIYGLEKADMMRERWSKIRKGKPSWNKGKKATLEARLNNSVAQKKLNRGEFLRKQMEWNKIHNPNFGMSGKQHSPETKIKISNSKKGQLPYMAGKNHSIESRKKMSATRVSLNIVGEKCYTWRGGISKERYGRGFNSLLKEEVVRRDGCCVICGRDKESIKKINIHHIDYDKNNNVSDNLVTLCFRCHMRTNHHREKWQSFFKEWIENCNRSTINLYTYFTEGESSA